MSSEFRRVPISTAQDFSWVFLTDWVLILSVSLLSAFYFGRVLGYTITTILEYLAWKRYGVKASVQSVKISFLGGRVFFKNLTVITQDQTYSILHGSITWRYWLLSSRKTSLESQSEKAAKLPCRFRIECQGLEHFIYNRTQAFDNILSSLPREDQENVKKFFSDPSPGATEETSTENDSAAQKSHLETSMSSPSASTESLNDRTYQLPNSMPSFLRLLPLEYSVQKGALIIGNKKTSSVMVSSFEKLKGHLDACAPDTKIDLYKIKLQSDITKFQMSLRPNLCYDNDEPLKNLPKANRLPKLLHKYYETFLRVRKRYLSRGSKTESTRKDLRNPLERWRGLGLYWKENDPAWDDVFHFELPKHEYARYSKVMKCEHMLIEYSHDTPGVVPHGAFPTLEPLDGPDVGNGGAPPDFSLDIQVFGANIHYGPWAHHEIMPIQKVFSPVVSRDSHPTERLSAGSTRVFTRLRISIMIMSDSIWRIPTREPSKDLDFLKRYKETEDETRPFGWLELSLAEGSEMRLNIAMCPTSTGFDNKLDLHFIKPEIRTSVNHDILLSAETHDIQAQIGYPLGWNAKAKWNFDLKSHQARMFILKDHITLLGDILSDFGTGDPTPYDLFRPFIYEFNWELTGYSMYLNVNDANIVNNPVDFNENCYLSFHGDDLRIGFRVPQDSIAGNSTTIDYNLYTPLFRLNMNTPSWNTLHEFMKDKEVGRACDFSLTGSYLFHSKLDVENIDTIIIECKSRMTTLKCYGYVVRFLVGVKMNYFGDFVHFKTTEEYMEELRDAYVEPKANSEQTANSTETTIAGEGEDKQNAPKNHTTDPVMAKKLSLKRMVNEKDVWFTFIVEEGCLILPKNLYDCNACFAFEFDSLDIDLRYINYYMDLQAALSPVIVKNLSDCDPAHLFSGAEGRCPSRANFGSISDLHIHAHRMFGLPPDEETYFCKWDFSMGVLDISSDLSCILSFGDAWSKLAFSFKDYENIMNYKIVPILDMTSIIFHAGEIRLKINDVAVDYYIIVEVENVTARGVDFENERYSSRADVDIHSITVQVKEGGEDGSLIGDFSSSLKITKFCQLENFLVHSMQQKSHIATNDAPFHRCSFLLPLAIQRSDNYRRLLGSIVPGVSIPGMVEPITPENVTMILDEFLKGEKNSLQMGNEHFYSKKEEDEYAFNFASGLISSTGIDSNVESESLVVNLIKPQASISACCIKPFRSFSDQAYSNFVEQLIDSNEIEVVLHFIETTLKRKQCKNVKVFSPTFDITLNNFGSDNISQTSDTVDIVIKEISVDISMREEPSPNSSEKSTVQDITALVKVESLALCVSNTFRNGPLEDIHEDQLCSTSIKDLEFWMTSEDICKSSFNATSIDTWVHSDKTELCCIFLKNTAANIDTITEVVSVHKERLQKAQRDFFYRISTASDEYQIIHDPPVITKPAYITRLPNQHVRENKSWKIVTRLRHILNYLPPSLLAEIYGALKSASFEAPTNAGEIFLNIFSKWRSWESSDVEQCYMYRKAFYSQPEGQAGPLNLRVEVDSCSATVSDSTHKEGDMIAVKGLKLLKKSILKSEMVGSILVIDDGTATDGNSLSCSLKAVKASISETAIKLLAFRELFESQNSQDILSNTQVSPSGKIPKLMELALLIDRCEIKISLDSKTANLKSFGNSISFALVDTESARDTGSSMALAWSWFEFDVRHNDAIIVDAFARRGSLGSFISQSEPTTLHRVHLGSQKLRLKVPSSTKDYCNFMNSLSESWSSLAPKLKFNTRSKDLSPEMKNFSKVAFEAHVDDFTSEISALSPLSISKRFKGLTIQFEKEANSSLRLKVENFDLDLMSEMTAQQYLKVSQSQVELTAKIHDKIEKVASKMQLESALTKFKLCDPREIIETLTQDLVNAKQNLEQLKIHLLALGALFGTDSTDEEVSAGALWPREWLWQLDMKYVGLLVPLGTTSYISEINELSSSLSCDEAAEFSFPLVHGELSVAGISFLINDKELPEDLSKVLDFAFRIKLAKVAENSMKSLQIESTHFRIALCPFSLIRILSLAYEATHLSGLQALKDNAGVKSSDDAKDFFNISQTFHSIQILSYDFCLGWIFNNDGASNSGLTWGYQRLFAAHEKPYGKLTLLDAYFSIARGSTSNDFYIQPDEVDRPNRSSLPSMQICYWFETNGSEDELFVRINGERLDVSFLSKSIGIAGGFARSLHLFQELKRQYLDPFKPEEPVKRVPAGSAFSKLPILSSISHVNCKVRYAGGVFKLYSLDDIKRKTGPSFQLESPSVDVIFEYTKMLTGKRKHLLRALMSVDSSHNTLFPTCVPIISEMALDIRQLLKDLNKSSVETPRTSNMQEGINYRSLLQDIDISFMMNIDKQQISLSCEPKAKVQADVGFEKFAMKLFTNDFDVLEPLSLSLDIHNITATSRHIFSREVSTSLNIECLSFVFMLTHPDTIHTYGIANIPTIDVYFNIKQLQDLNVFINIWKLDSKILSQPELDNKFVIGPTNLEKPLTSKYKKVISNSSFPWNFVVILSRIRGEIDLGISLGVLSLTTEKIWAVTDHYSDWTQTLSLQLDKLSLSSDGRLGGTFLLQNFRWMSQIKWPLNEGSFESPLVVLKIFLDETAVKLTFDYHLVLIASVEKLSLSLFNKRDPRGVIRNLLSVSLSSDSTQVFLTALAPANIFDVYNTILRMRKDNRKSYLETLGDSNTRDTKGSSSSHEILSSLSFLRTELSVMLKFVHIQVYPSTLFDMEVMTFKARDFSTFSQTEGSKKLKTQLKLKVHNVKLALSTYKSQLHERVASQIGVKEYIEHASKVDGGTILSTPAILIGMTTWHDVATNKVELLYSNSFGGKIGVRWNLGSINFLREMWATHARAMALRRSHNGQSKSFFEDEHLGDKLKDVDLGDEYTYIPLEEPHIEIPQTKDLGEATPPVEWFGVNRKQFPGLTHQGMIVPLQKLAHLAESEWARILGRA